MALAAAAPAHADATFPRRACAEGALIRSAGLAWGTSGDAWTTAGGPAANVMLSVEPSARARTARHRVALADAVWRDLHRCVAVPRALDRRRRASLRAQLLCHAYWSATPLLRLGGRLWDLEAWRPPASRAAVLAPTQITDPERRCNWGPDTGPPMAGSP